MKKLFDWAGSSTGKGTKVYEAVWETENGKKLQVTQCRQVGWDSFVCSVFDGTQWHRVVEMPASSERSEREQELLRRACIVLARPVVEPPRRPDRGTSSRTS